MKRLLIVGDWVVDDNWLTGIHRSTTGLRTGQQHTRSLHAPGSPVQAFCGAGRLASILYHAKVEESSKQPSFKITGLGIWGYEKDGNRVIDDAALLQSMFDFEFRKKQGPFFLRSRPLANSNLPAVKLHNIAKCLYEQPGHEAEHFATTRVFRVHQRRKGQLELLARNDWEFPPRHRDEQAAPEWIAWHDGERFARFLRNAKITKNNIDAILIKDLIKGVVSERLVEVLAREFGDKPWFVSSKRWNPPWLKHLAKTDLKLLLIPPVAASSALTEEESLDGWIAPDKAMPTKEAMELFRRLQADIRRDNPPLFAVSPTEGNVLARLGDSYVVKTQPVPKSAPLVGWASAFFSSLCGGLLRSPVPGSNFAPLIYSSLAFAESWADSEAAFLESPTDANPNPPAQLSFTTSASSSMVLPSSWDSEWKDWSFATQSNGILENSEPPRIELWRGMTALSGYICFQPEKRKALSTLAHLFRDFAKHPIDRHQAVQLLAEPGSGKSHLVSCLVNASGLFLLPYNITQLNRRQDILSCFDAIVTSQAASPDKPVLVFFDEINARIEGNHVYDAFLSALEDSVYVRGGTTFHIKPCVWIFAGTTGEVAVDPSSKYDDFISRLSMGTIRLGNATQIEKVYLGAQLVLTRFPDVQSISRGALQEFAGFEGSVRDLRTLVWKLENVQGGVVSKANFPGRNEGPDEQFIAVR